MVREGQVLVGPQFSEPLLVETVRADDLDAWFVVRVGQRTAVSASHPYPPGSGIAASAGDGPPANEKSNEKVLVLKGSDIRELFGVNQWLERNHVIALLSVPLKGEVRSNLQPSAPGHAPSCAE